MHIAQAAAEVTMRSQTSIELGCTSDNDKQRAGNLTDLVVRYSQVAQFVLTVIAQSLCMHSARPATGPSHCCCCHC
jgi:hypothetical protein